MTDTVIRVENLGKKYIINHQQQEQYSTLRDAIANRARAFTQKPLKYFAQNNAQSGREEFWALKDVSFDIKQGDRVGVIGRNWIGGIFPNNFKKLKSHYAQVSVYRSKQG